MNMKVRDATDMELTEMFDKEVLEYLARRHSASTDAVVEQFLKQSNIGERDASECGFTLETNEMEILRDYYLRGISIV